MKWGAVLKTVSNFFVATCCLSVCRVSVLHDMGIMRWCVLACAINCLPSIHPKKLAFCFNIDQSPPPLSNTELNQAYLPIRL